MKKYKTFAGRLTLRVTLLVFATMIIVALVVLVASFHAIKAETEGRYQGMMDVVNEKLGKILFHEELCARNVFDEVWDHLDSPESVMRTIEREIQLNNYTQGYYVAFEPGYFPEYPMWFEPYMNIHENRARNIGSYSHDYFKSSWYIRAKKENKSFWTDPYPDDVGGLDNVCSFCMPLYDSRGRLAGVCGSDMSLKWLMSQLKDITAVSHNYGLLNFDFLQKNAFYSFILTSDGMYISHADENRIMKDNVRTHVGAEDSLAVEDMLRLKHGQAQMTIDGVRSVVYYAPLESVNWVMGIVVPRTTMWIPALMMISLLLIIMIIGLVVIFRFCSSSIRQVSSPLSALALSADEVAKGNFNAPLPEITHKDEVCQLRDSFATMQESLSQYMKDLEHTTAQQSAIEKELKIAYNIQMSMIPRKYPPFPKRHDIDIYGHMTPAKSVGGDLFDFFIREERLFFCIGDVSGKSVSAALWMTVTKKLFHTISLKVDDPSEIMSQLNNAMSDGNDTSMFVTMFIGVLDLKTGHLDFCNGGHCAPVIYSSEAAFLPMKTNTLVGLMSNMPFIGGEMEMAPGTTILLYTDGLTEAMNKDDELYTAEKLLDYSKKLARQEDLTSQQLIELLLGSVSRFVDGAEQSDDLTLLAVRYLGPEQK